MKSLVPVDLASATPANVRRTGRILITRTAASQVEVTALLQVARTIAQTVQVEAAADLVRAGEDCLVVLSWEEALSHGSPLSRAIESERQRASVLVVANRELQQSERDELLVMGATDVLDISTLRQADLGHLINGALARAESRRRLLREVDTLRHLSFKDPLTGLWSRYFLEHELRRRLDDGRWSGLALIAFDIDKFKHINEAFGPSGGDTVLKETARRLLSLNRNSVRAYRTGADEFVVLVEAESRSDVKALAAVLRDELQASVEVGGEVHDLAVDVGIAFADDAGCNPPELLRAAELALRISRKFDEGAPALFFPQMRAEAKGFVLLERELKQALTRRELCLVYQPQISTKSGRVVGLESLLRWRHPSRGLLSPDSFLPAAERAGLMEAITEFVIRSACSELGPLLRSRGLRLAINVGASDLQPNCLLLDHLMQAALEARLSPEHLEVEITEHALIEDLGAARETLEALRRTGVAIALDDFGVGYSSLSYLRELPITVLKIDRSFVKDLIHRQRDQQLLLGILELARRLGIETVAEGVETPDQRSLLERAGTDRVQGYLIAKPMPLNQIEFYLRASSFD